MVFVPAIMGAGVAFSAATVVRDVLSYGTRTMQTRRAGVRGRLVAATVVEAHRPELAEASRAAPRSVLGAAGALAAVFGIYVAVGATGNFLRTGGYTHDIAWLWGSSLLVSVLALILAVSVLAFVFGGERPPAWVWPTLVPTPLLGVEHRAGGRGRRVTRLRWTAVGALSIVTLLSGLATWPKVLEPLDRRGADLIDAPSLSALDGVGRFVGATGLTVVVAVFIGVVTLRCKRLAWVFISSVIVSLIVTGAIRTFVDRPRPVGGSRVGETDSFPSGHLVQITLLAALVPLAMDELFGSRRIRRIAAFVMAAMVGLVAIARVANGFHHPTDVIAGIGIGVAMGSWAQLAVAVPDSHFACNRCRTARLLRDDANPHVVAQLGGDDSIGGSGGAVGSGGIVGSGGTVGSGSIVGSDGPVESGSTVGPGSPDAAGPSATREEDERDGRRGVFALSDRTAFLIRTSAIVYALVAAGVLAVSGIRGRLPRNPEGDWFAGFEAPAQYGLLGIVALGALVALRWPAVAAVMLALAGVGLTALAAVTYRPVVASGAAVVMLAPAVALWVAWQRRETWGRIATLAAVTSLLLGASWVSASAVYDHFFGPAHPQSATSAVDEPLVDWAWSGAVTAHGFGVVVRPAQDAARVDIDVVAPGAAGEPVANASAPVVDGVARFVIDGLQPATDHTYGFVVDGAAANGWTGSVRTFGVERDTVRIAVSSCARTGSNGRVFDAIRNTEPDLYLITGDMHYSNIARNSVAAFDRAYERVLTAPAQAALYRSVPVAYVWDDHDYSGNDGDSSSASRPAARSSYERNVAHHPLVSDQTINQAFSIDGVRVVMLDTRSARVPGSTLLGAGQLEWLRAELRASSTSHDLVIVVSPTPWIGEASASADTWAGFEDERASLSSFIAEQGLDNLLIVSGDAHMIAIDDGTNSDYSGSGEAGIPVFQAAALDRPGNVKGGPYSEGAYPGAGQFGIIEVRRVGDRAVVTLEGRTYDDDVVVSYEFEV